MQHSVFLFYVSSKKERRRRNSKGCAIFVDRLNYIPTLLVPKRMSGKKNVSERGRKGKKNRTGGKLLTVANKIDRIIDIKECATSV